MSGDVREVHRSFYEAVEAGDIDLLAALWVDSPSTACAHPGHEPIIGTGDILRSWTMLMAASEYLQFFLTDVHVAFLADGAVAVVTCTENILSGQGLDSADQFVGGRVTSTSVLQFTGRQWRFHSRHAAPIVEFVTSEEEIGDF